MPPRFEVFGLNALDAAPRNTMQDFLQGDSKMVLGDQNNFLYAGPAQLLDQHDDEGVGGVLGLGVGHYELSFGQVSVILVDDLNPKALGATDFWSVYSACIFPIYNKHPAHGLAIYFLCENVELDLLCLTLEHFFDVVLAKLVGMGTREVHDQLLEAAQLGALRFLGEELLTACPAGGLVQAQLGLVANLRHLHIEHIDNLLHVLVYLGTLAQLPHKLLVLVGQLLPRLGVLPIVEGPDGLDELAGFPENGHHTFLEEVGGLGHLQEVEALELLQGQEFGDLSHHLGFCVVRIVQIVGYVSDFLISLLGQMQQGLILQNFLFLQQVDLPTHSGLELLEHIVHGGRPVPDQQHDGHRLDSQLLERYVGELHVRQGGHHVILLFEGGVDQPVDAALVQLVLAGGEEPGGCAFGVEACGLLHGQHGAICIMDYLAAELWGIYSRVTLSKHHQSLYALWASASQLIINALEQQLPDQYIQIWRYKYFMCPPHIFVLLAGNKNQKKRRHSVGHKFVTLTFCQYQLADTLLSRCMSRYVIMAAELTGNDLIMQIRYPLKNVRTPFSANCCRKQSSMDLYRKLPSLSDCIRVFTQSNGQLNTQQEVPPMPPARKGTQKGRSFLATPGGVSRVVICSMQVKQKVSPVDYLIRVGANPLYRPLMPCCWIILTRASKEPEQTLSAEPL